jgi:hypothetical protein
MVVAIAMVELAWVTPSFGVYGAPNLTGSWVGKVACKGIYGADRASWKMPSVTLYISQPAVGPGDLPGEGQTANLRVVGASYGVGIPVPGTVYMTGSIIATNFDTLTQGKIAVASCNNTNAIVVTGNGNLVGIGDAKVDVSGGGRLKLKYNYITEPTFLSCTMAVSRISLTDPLIPGCP